jgi:ankyrin repeat protein
MTTSVPSDSGGIDSLPPPEWDLLLSYAQKNLPDNIRTLVLEQGVPPNHANGVGQSALHISALWGHLEAVQALLELGAPTNTKNTLTGATPLIMTAFSRKTSIERKTQVTQALLAYGADPGIADMYEKTAFDYLDAADVPKDHILRQLLTPKAPPLWQALDDMNLDDVVRILQEQESAITMTFESQTPLEKAVQQFVEYLDDPETSQTVDEHILSTFQQIIQTLVEANKSVSKDQAAPPSVPMGNADVNMIPNEPPLVALIDVLCRRILARSVIPPTITEILQYLATASPPLSVDHVSRFWHDAARRGRLGVLQYLHDTLPQFFAVNVRNRQDMTALHFGARSGRTNVVIWLLGQPDVDVNAKDGRGQTPRQAALVNQHSEVIQLLDQAGADQDA